MKYFVAVLALAAVAFADVAHLKTAEQAAEILSQDADVLPDKFQYRFQTSNGISAEQSGALKSLGPEENAIVVQGSNTYTGPDGVQYSLTYSADENGYQAFGAHLPTTPAPLPIPDYILRAIEYIETHPPKSEPTRF